MHAKYLSQQRFYARTEEHVTVGGKKDTGTVRTVQYSYRFSRLLYHVQTSLWLVDGAPTLLLLAVETTGTTVTATVPGTEAFETKTYVSRAVKLLSTTRACTVRAHRSRLF